MLTGRHLSQANTRTKVMMKHGLEPVPHVRDLDPELPPAADDVVARAMAKERSGRFPTCWVSGLLVGLNGSGEPLPVLTAASTSTPGLAATRVPPPDDPQPKGPQLPLRRRRSIPTRS